MVIREAAALAVEGVEETVRVTVVEAAEKALEAKVREEVDEKALEAEKVDEKEEAPDYIKIRNPYNPYHARNSCVQHRARHRHNHHP